MRSVLPCLLALAVAAGPAPGLSSPALAASAAYADVLRLPPGDRRFARYLWMPRPGADLKVAQRLHWNLLSREKEFGTPVEATSDLLRLDLREYRLPADVWEKFAAIDVFFHSKKEFLAPGEFYEFWPGGKVGGKFFRRGRYTVKAKAGAAIDRPAFFLPEADIDGLRAETCSEAPIVYGLWALVQSCRDISIRNEREGVGYRDFLRFQNRGQFFDLTGMDPVQTLKKLQELRAAVTTSGISQQARFVESVRGVNGEGWFTLDHFHDPVVRRNLRRGEVAHDAERHIAPLSNGLPGNGLFAADGTAQDSAPDKLGPDDSPSRVGRDGRIHENKTCWGCHAAWKRGDEYLKPLRTDWTRSHFRIGPGGAGRALTDPSKKVQLELRRQYLSDLGKALDDGRRNYRYAIGRVTATTENPRGLSVYEAGRLYVGEINWYIEEPVTLERAALEAGVTPARLLAAIRAWERKVGQVEDVLAGYLTDPPESLTRLEWEASYQLAQALLTGRGPASLTRKKKKQ